MQLQKRSGVGAPAIRNKQPLPSMQASGEVIAQCIAPDLYRAQSLNSQRRQYTSSFMSESARKDLREGIEKGKDVTGLVRDAAESGIEFMGKAGSGARALQALPTYLAAAEHSMMDLARIKGSMEVAQRMERSSDAAASALTFMKPMVQETEGLLASQRQMAQTTRLLIAQYGGLAKSNPGKMALAVEDFISDFDPDLSVLKTGQKVVLPALKKTLFGVGAATAAWKTYEDSPAEGWAGKATHAGLSGGMALGADVAVSRLNPLVGLVDTAIKYGSKAFGEEAGKFGESITIGKWAEGTANVYFALGRAAWNLDSAPLDELHRQNISGQNGAVLQGWAMIGDLMGDGICATADWISNVSEDVNESVKWWSADGTSCNTP
jgi:hypothetical protein